MNFYERETKSNGLFMKIIIIIIIFCSWLGISFTWMCHFDVLLGSSDEVRDPVIEAISFCSCSGNNWSFRDNFHSNVWFASHLILHVFDVRRIFMVVILLTAISWLVFVTGYFFPCRLRLKSGNRYLGFSSLNLDWNYCFVLESACILHDWGSKLNWNVHFLCRMSFVWCN